MKVYFIQEGKNGCVKIGKAKDVDSRLRTMQTGNSRMLFVRLILNYESHAKALEMESYYHYLFRGYRIRGEWFSSKVLKEIRNASEEECFSKMVRRMNKHKY